MITSPKKCVWMMMVILLPVIAQAQTGKLDAAYLCGIDGSCIYSPLVAERYELVITTECGAWHDQLKADNPNVTTFIYTSGTDNYTQPVDVNRGWYYGGREHAWLKQRCRELGYSPEILYLHYYENTTVSGFSIPGTYSTTLTDADSVSRVPVYLGYYQGEGVGRMLVNFAHPITRQLQIEYAKKAWTDPNAGADWPQSSQWDGYYLDNWLAHELDPAMGQIGSVTSGGRLVEHPSKAVVYSSEAIDWFQQQQNQFARELRDTLHNGAAWAPDGKAKYLCANIANSWIDDFADPAISGLDYLLQEFQYSPLRCPEYALHDAYSRDSACYANGAYPIYVSLQTEQPSSGSGSVTQAEALYDNLAWYYVTRGPNTYIYQYHQGPSTYWIDADNTGWDTLTWRGCMDFEVGTSLGRYSELQSGTDPTGQAYRVYQREYSNALVLMRPRLTWNGNITSQTAVTVNLPTAYREVRIDGTLGGERTTFTLRNGRGLLLAKVDAGMSILSSPTPSTPANGATITTDAPLLVVGNAYDSEGRSLLYEFQLDPNGDWVGGDLFESSPGQLTTPNATTTGWVVPLTLNDGASYFWRARVVTTSGATETSAWSTSFEFTVSLIQGNNCPSSPAAVSPADGWQTTAGAPTLTVRNATDADGDPLTYEFIVALDPGFSDVVAAASWISGGSSTTSWTVSPQLGTGETYYWRARAADGFCTGGWSASCAVTIIGGNQPPPVPLGLTPKNDDSASGDFIDLIVENSIDPDGDQVWYQFMFCEDGQIVDIEDNVVERQGLTTNWQPRITLTAGKSYTWRVQCHDARAYSGWSPVYSFFYGVAENSSPGAPLALAPVNGADLNEDAPQLQISNSLDSDGDILTYEFEVCSDAGMNNVVTSVNGHPEGPSTTGWLVDPSLPRGKSYFWRARAHDGQHFSNWSTPESFAVVDVNQTPPVPLGISPNNGDTVGAGQVSLVVENVIDPDGDQLQYQFVLYKGGILIDAAEYVPQGSGSTTSWQPNGTLPGNTSYTWRVQCNDSESYSGWSPRYSFYCGNQQPPIPAPGAPLTGDTLISSSVIFSMAKVIDPDGDPLTYDFQVFADSTLTIVAVQATGIPAQVDGVFWTTTLNTQQRASYWWRGRAVDPSQPGEWCPTQEFVLAPLVTCVAPTVEFVGSPLVGQAPLVVNFQDQSTNALTWSWDFGDGGQSSEQNPSHTFSAAGSYQVSLTVGNGCGSKTQSKTGYLTVAPPLVNAMHVNALQVNLQIHWGRVSATARVQVVDNQGNPVTGAGVTGKWSGGAKGTMELVTDSSGWAFSTRKLRRRNSNATFCILQVVKADWLYDGDADIRTCADGGGIISKPIVDEQADDGTPATPDELSAQNYPNPFNATTSIRLYIPEEGRIAVDVFNVLGRHVNRLLDKTLPAGEFVVSWDGHDQRGEKSASGIYFYQVTLNGEQRITRKMVIAK